MVKNITPELVYRLNGMHHVVAQVGAVIDNHILPCNYCTVLTMC